MPRPFEQPSFSGQTSPLGQSCMNYKEPLMGAIFWIVLALVLVYAITLYNSLVNVKNAVSKAWANIDVLLKQRHEELPKLVDTCKQYMQYEQGTLEKVTQARSRVSEARQSHDLGALGLAEGALRSGLENAIADRREFYNESVNINNVAIEQFPGVLLARLFNFKAFDLLKFAAAELKDVDIAQRFKA